MLEPEIPEASKTDTPVKLSGNAVNVPSAWILLLLVPLFVGAIYIQGFEFVNRQSSREAKIEKDASIREFSNARSAFDEQAAGWQKLGAARKSQIAELEVTLTELESKVKVQSVIEREQSAKAEEGRLLLESLTKELEARRSDLNEVQAESQTTKSRSRAVEGAIADLQKTYVARRVERDETQAVLNRLTDEVASNTVKLKQQLDSIQANETTLDGLARAKNELAGIAQEKTTVEKILATLTPEVQRLTSKRSEVIAAIESLQKQSDQFSEVAIADFKKTYTALKAETEQLQSESTKLSSEITANLAKYKQQQEFLKTNGTVVAELASAKAELAGIAQQKQTVEKILETVNPEVQRLSVKRNELLAETDFLQKQVDEKSEQWKQLTKKRNELLKEIESLKSETKPEKDQ